MPLSNTIDSYTPELEIFERALDDPKGTRVCYENYNLAHQGRSRFQQARALDRVQSKRIYPETDKLYGKSAYDVLVCRIKEDSEGMFWVYIERHGREILAVESLSEVET